MTLHVGAAKDALDLDLADTEEITVDRPAGRAFVNWASLAEKIAALPNEHSCIRLKRCLDQSLISSLRNYLAKHHSIRLISRSRPGETYLWKGGAL